MSRYIDKDKLKVVVMPIQETDYSKGWNDAVTAIMENAENEDVAPVVHAHWAWYYDIDQDRDFKEPFSSENKSGWICSHCKGRLEDLVGGKWDEIDEPPVLEYCPRCGAKMNEKEENINV